MADDFLVRDGPVSVPMEYVVPQGGELIPLAVRATVDGTSAASSFYAAVQIVSPSGRVMANAVSPAISAGASRDVTWFPHLGGSGASVATAALQAVRVNIVGNQTIAQGDPGTVVTWGEAAFDTGSPTPFWSAGTPTVLTAPVAGYYLSMPNPIWDLFTHPITSDAETAFYLYAGGQTPDGFHALTKHSETPMGPIHFSFIGQHHAPVHLAAGDTVKINAYFDDGNGGFTQPSLNLLDLRVSGYTSLVTSWSMFLIGAT